MAQTLAKMMTCPLPQLVPGPWLPLDDDEVAAFVPYLAAHLQAAGLTEWSAQAALPVSQLHAVPLSFYPGWVLVSGHCALGEGEQGVFDVLMGPGFFHCLNGQTMVLHQINVGVLRQKLGPEREDVCIPSPLAVLEPRHTGPDYLRFFCHAIRGEFGAYRVVETAQDLRDLGLLNSTTLVPLLKPLQMQWKQGAKPPQSAKDALLAPAVMTTEVCMVYGAQLFLAKLELGTDGRMTMLEEKMLAAQLEHAADGVGAGVTNGWLRNITLVIKPGVSSA